MAEHNHGPTPAIPATADANAGSQAQLVQLGGGQVNMGSADQTTFLPIEQKPNLPPNMRSWTRWEYLSEYIGYWKYGVITKAVGWLLVLIGVLMLGVFAPGGLLCIIVAARLIDLAWWYNFITKQFGTNRTLVLVD